MGAELVLMQEQRKIGTRQHYFPPSLQVHQGGEESRVCTAQSKASRKKIVSRTDLTVSAADYVQVLDIADDNLPGGSI